MTTYKIILFSYKLIVELNNLRDLTKRIRWLPCICIVSLSFLLSCHLKSQPDNIIVKIILPKNKTKSFLGKFVYLIDASKQAEIDSLLVTGDTILFNKKSNTSFVPFMVSVSKLDTFNGHAFFRPFGFSNPYFKKSFYCYFYVDKGITIIKPYFMDDNTIQSSISGSKQNVPYLKNIELKLPGNDSLNRQSIIDRNISIIKEYPYSVDILNQLFWYKEKFLTQDLKKQLTYFDDNLQKSQLFKDFADYFTISSVFDKSFPSSIKLEDKNGKYQEMGNKHSVYNLIVFWASWCGACRAEIPKLKNLYKKFGNKGLTITNISIDGEKKDWLTALAREKMPWKQLIAIDSTKTVIDINYNIKVVPKMYLFNNKNQLIGTSENNYISTKFIDSLISKEKAKMNDF